MNKIASKSPQPQSQNIELLAQVAERLNLAFQQNNVAAISQIELVNGTDEDINDITITITAKPLFLHKKTFRFDQIKKGSSRKLSPVPVDLDASFLSAVNAETSGQVSIVARAGNGEIAAQEITCTLIPPNEWPGLTGGPELIAAFVQPNDPAVAGILRNASEKLQHSGRSPVLDGYQSHNKGRTWELAEAIFAALGDENIVLAGSKPNFEREGLLLRCPSDLLNQKTATKLELVLLLAACLEQAGLDPLVGFNDGHVFCGLWLSPGDPSFRLVSTAQSLRPRIANHDLLLIEAAMLAVLPRVRFRTAAAKAAILVAESTEKPLDVVVNIREARYRDIRSQTGTVLAIPEASRALPKSTETKITDAKGSEKGGRLDQWRRQLLDVASQNPLLNFKMGKEAVALICDDPRRLEDELVRGEKFRLLPKPSLVSTSSAGDVDFAALEAGDAAARQQARDALQRGEIHAHLGHEALNERLPEIYSASQEAFAQGLGNSLHLAIGFVSWRLNAKAPVFKAPLILLPVALERRSVRSGFRLVRFSEDARLNPALIHMLNRDFGLELAEFREEFASDAHGLDIANIFAVMRAHLATVKQTKLSEEIVLTNISFSRFMLWKDVVGRTKDLYKNAVIAHMLKSSQQPYGNDKQLPEPRKLDAEIEPCNLWIPLPADAAQTSAVVAAAYGRDFILHAAPGTGGTQTIANMIVQLLGDGKSVLFVSHKATALQSVYQQLDRIGLSAFCLRMYGRHGQKDDVLSQLKTAWETRATQVPKDWYVATSDIKRLRDKLNGVAFALHRPHRNGMSVHGAISLVMQQKTLVPGLELTFDGTTPHDEAQMRRPRGRCREIQTALANVGSVDSHIFSQIGKTQWSPLWQKSFLDAIEDFDCAAIALEQTCAQTSEIFDVAPSAHPQYIMKLLTFFGQAIMPCARMAAPLLSADHFKLHDAYFKWFGLRAQYSMVSAGLVRKYRDGVFELDLVGLLDEWRKASGKLLLATKHKRRVCDALSNFTDQPVTEDAGAEIARLIDLKALRQQASGYDGLLANICAGWSGFNSNSDEIEQLLAWETTTRLHAKNLDDPVHSEAYWLDKLLEVINERNVNLEEKGLVRKAIACLYHDYKSFGEAHSKLVELADLQDQWLGFATDENWLPKVRNFTSRWRLAADDLQRWCQWCAVATAASELGLSPLVSALRSGRICADEVLNLFELAYARGWVMQMVDRDPLLRSFVAEQHEDAISRYQKLDDRVAELARQVVIGRLSGEIPSRASAAKVPEFALLAAQMEKQSRQMPVRELLGQIPNVLARLAPCVMMNLESVARHLPVDGRNFDVVIFDEASQILIGEALGAMSRATQVIVVGDCKQLSPAQLKSNSDFSTHPESPKNDPASLLQECVNAQLPSQRLLTQYRSVNEGLIAFSNQHYYQGELATFPINSRTAQGLRFIGVSQSLENTGTNQLEAETIVRCAMGYLSDSKFIEAGRSLGIVTFTNAQKMLIERLMDQQRHAFPGLETAFSGEVLEPVFVKDVDSAQGEVRDIILLSTVFTRDASGNPPKDFGRLSEEGGEQYLNVAISRARQEMVVVSSLKPIDFIGHTSLALTHLAEFLESAQAKPQDASTANLLETADADRAFEDLVQKALETQGWTVHPRLGASHQRVSLAIVHPDRPDEYLAGIDCDSVRFAAGSHARTRDRLRALMMQQRGWILHKVWALDWWINADRALARLQIVLENILAVSRLPLCDREKAEPIDAPQLSTPKLMMEEEPQEALVEPQPSSLEVVPVLVTLAKTEPKPIAAIVPATSRYKAADIAAIGLPLNRTSFYDDEYQTTLKTMVQHVIAQEGPIFADLLVHRIARAHHFARATDRIRDIVLNAIDLGNCVSVEDGRKLYWPPGANMTTMPEFRSSLPNERAFTDIPLLELADRVRQLCGTGISNTMILHQIAKDLGLAPVSSVAKDRLGQAIQLAQFAGYVAAA